MNKVVEVAEILDILGHTSRGARMGQWFIIRCEGRKIKTVASDLGGYLPVMQRLTKPARKKQPVVSEVPLFPGWVFVPFMPQLYQRAPLLAGVRGIMKYGRMGPLFLNDWDMDRIREIEQTMPSVVVERIRNPYSVGDTVEVLGLLAGMRGTVTRVRGEELVVDVGGNFPISVNHCLVAPISL